MLVSLTNQLVSELKTFEFGAEDVLSSLHDNFSVGEVGSRGKAETWKGR